jgi:predicted O-methyltransferase YrrM
MRAFATRRLHLRHEGRSLRRVDAIRTDCRSLTRSLTAEALSRTFQSPDLSAEWTHAEKRIGQLQITDMSQGVNPGDRRALWYLVRHLRPQNALEIGTHIGASTVHLAAALPSGGRLVTVDIEDVNDETAKPWLHHGAAASPAQFAAQLRLNVEFVTSDSLGFLSSCKSETFDLVFLDGDHAAATVYQEIPAACRTLRRGGVIVLHDFFPNLMPLWPNGVVIEGPWRAVERLRAEDARLEALPLGELPWPTKLGSRVTSLAVLVGTSPSPDHSEERN